MARQSSFNSNNKRKPKQFRDKDCNSKANRAERQGGKPASKERDFEDKSGANDPKWYASNPSLLRDAASIPFSWAVGTPFSMNNPLIEEKKAGGFVDRHVIPGIMTIELMPTYGSTQFLKQPALSPLNIASNSLYTYVRHQNSGHANYDAPDLMIYVMAMSQVYSAIVWLQRIYGIATLYSQQNRYLPDALLQAQSVDPEDIRNNLATFRYDINLLIQQAASFCVPNTMPIFQREVFLYQNIYTEGTSIKDQLYMYKPLAFLKYGGDTTASSLVPQYLMTQEQGASGYLLKAKDLTNLVQQLMTPLKFSEDMNIMGGDILKAYGTNIIKVAPMDTFYPIVPIFDIGVLEQMKNATCVGNLVYSGIAQDPTHGFLISDPQARRQQPGSAPSSLGLSVAWSLLTLEEDKLLTTTTRDVSPELIIESTRLMAAGFDWSDVGTAPTGQDWFATTHITGGAEVATYFELYQYKMVDGNYSLVGEKYYYDFIFPVNGTAGGVGDTWYTNEAYRLGLMSHFRFHPCYHSISVAPITATGSDTPYRFTVRGDMLVFDVDNYALIDRDELSRMHEAALLSLFNVPFVTTA